MSKATQNGYKSFEDFAKGVAVVFLGAFSIYLLKGLFENDGSKIISSRGRKFLNDEEKMKEIHSQINNQGTANEIVI